MKFPGGAVFLFFCWAFQKIPTVLIFELYFFRKQKDELAFNMSRNCTPPLLITAHCFKGRAKKLSKFPLGFIQPFPKCNELCSLHNVRLRISSVVKLLADGHS
jgi:hypothetical protein